MTVTLVITGAGTIVSEVWANAVAAAAIRIVRRDNQLISTVGNRRGDKSGKGSGNATAERNFAVINIEYSEGGLRFCFEAVAIPRTRVILPL